MANPYFDIAFTPRVKTWQERWGSRAAYGRAAEHAGEAFSAREIEFVEARDTFFLASVSDSGWPYVQHRGGPPGFVRHLQDSAIGWAEFAGNRQFVSSGNAEGDSRVAMIFLDFAQSRRLKLLGHLPPFDAADRPDLALRLAVDGYAARVERMAMVEVLGFDWNCPQHIVRRFTAPEMEQFAAPLQVRIAELQMRLEACDPP